MTPKEIEQTIKDLTPLIKSMSRSYKRVFPKHYEREDIEQILVENWLTYGIHRYDPTQMKLTSYGYLVMHSAMIDYVRRYNAKKREVEQQPRRMSSMDADIDTDDGVVTLHDLIPDNTQQDIYNSIESIEYVRQLIDRLFDERQAFIVMAVAKGLTIEEAADMIGVCRKTGYNIYNRGMEKIKRMHKDTIDAQKR